MTASIRSSVQPQSIVLTTVVAFLGVVPLSARLSAQPDDAGKKVQAAERLHEMQQRAGAFAAFALRKGSRVSVPLHGEPLHRFNDPARDFSDGTLWALGRSGRPVALLTMELYPQSSRGPSWVYELASLATDGIELDRKDGWRWAPAEPGLDLRAFASAPVPADMELARLQQMKELSRRFTAYDVSGANRDRFELRLLPRPVHRYSDPDSGLVDGALFILAYGTNPEVILAIECSRQHSGTPAWRYGLQRLTSSNVHVNLDDQEVWSRQHVAKPSNQDPYTFFSFEPDKAAK